jgi:hypothetical protein
LSLLLIPITFDTNSKTYKIHDYIQSQLQPGELPKIFWDGTKDFDSIFATTAASFTERGWWQRGYLFPKCNQIDGGMVTPGEKIFILSHQEITMTEKYAFERCMGKYQEIARRVFLFDDVKYYVIVAIKPLVQIFPKVFSGAELPTQVGEVRGSRMLSKIGSAGYVSYGPYLVLDPGKYKCFLYYKSEDKDLFLEAVITPSKSINQEILQRKSLQSYAKTFGVQSISFHISPANNVLECRVFTSGIGKVEIKKLVIDKIP